MFAPFDICPISPHYLWVNCRLDKFFFLSYWNETQLFWGLLQAGQNIYMCERAKITNFINYKNFFIFCILKIVRQCNKHKVYQTFFLNQLYAFMYNHKTNKCEYKSIA